jgi:hypothetical protein
MFFKNLDEEIEFFSTNSEIDVHTKEISDGEKIVIVDNFYKHPDKVRELALTIPKTFNPRILWGMPGGRVESPYYFSHLGYLYTEIITNVWPDRAKTMEDTFVQNCIDHASFLVNVQNSDLPPRVPHIDNISIGRFASGIFLNTPEECAGGTAFYKYHGEISVDMSNPDIKLKNYNYYVQETDNEDWEKIYLAEMKYNRMIIYPQNLLHTPYIPANTFTDETPRLIQMFFI